MACDPNPADDAVPAAAAGAALQEAGDDPLLGEIVLSSERIQNRVAELGAEITEAYADRPPLLVGVLKGAFVVMSDIARHIRLPIEFDFMAVASYGTGTTSSGVVRILKDLDAQIAGRHILVVEDIVDSGLTLNYLLRNLEMRKPASIDVCALLVKRNQQRVELPLRFVGFDIEPDFVVGYGLDHAERFRQLPYIAALNAEALDG